MEENLERKLKKFNLSEGEEEKARRCLLGTLSYVSDDEIDKCIAFLAQHNIVIKNAWDIRITTIPVEKLAEKISLMQMIGESDLYISDPSALSYNALDINRRIRDCKDKGIQYKKLDENGKYVYEPFVLFEKLWSEKRNVLTATPEPKDNKVDFSPVEEVKEEKEEVFNIDDNSDFSSFKENPFADYDRPIDLAQYIDPGLTKESGEVAAPVSEEGPIYTDPGLTKEKDNKPRNAEYDLSKINASEEDLKKSRNDLEGLKKALEDFAYEDPGYLYLGIDDLGTEEYRLGNR